MLLTATIHSVRELKLRGVLEVAGVAHAESAAFWRTPDPIMFHIPDTPAARRAYHVGRQVSLRIEPLGVVS